MERELKGEVNGQPGEGWNFILGEYLATLLYALWAPPYVQGVPWILDCLSQLHPGCHLPEPENLPPLGIGFPIAADTGVLGTQGGLSSQAHQRQPFVELYHICCCNKHLGLFSVWEHKSGNWDLVFHTPWAMGNSPPLEAADLGSG